MNFEEQYISLRKKEGRLYSDAEVAALPFIPAQHPLLREWQMRQDTYQRFIRYIERERWISTVAEIGCGNGWLCRRMQEAGGNYVWGIDTNHTELEQAARVFGGNKKLRFLLGGPDQLDVLGSEADLIVMAGSIQYFPDLSELFTALKKHLHADGEIHILDSPFYKKDEVAAARKRTEEYYSRMGFPGLSEYYHHHSLDELAPFRPGFLYKPTALKNQLGKLKGRPASPFPWIRVKK